MQTYARAAVRPVFRGAPTSSIATQKRSFHSPFTVLNSAHSPLTNPPSSSSTVSHITSSYEKQDSYVSEEPPSPGAPRTYVVSEPDPAHTPYEVPSGAFPTSAPYDTYQETSAPNPSGAHSSTSASPPHPNTTRRVLMNAWGVGESAAVRHGEAPGEMGKRGGGQGGLGLMDKEGTRQGELGQLADRNPQPDSDVAPKWSKLGVDQAWKERK
ncbi:hypothetical protein CONPUDRAFT_151049 [Coniophora puteana RWD-64-598 SS2]|uniref:Uncharacterized protein n=1 Tax=Coniophora puteana (strain RWD-64-598) TaxID=741705 RepID=A0A5M3MY01_CONPW|nr:uncharacterized protein CONPUDRAFT_151049 [Coniophora puteana RWD-64-598 SS2]EIW84002.1 hypothetical protein CONPUDRAFT_151049 [Coniophora puteana RWD-64-598 SS2]